jgi:hypothetical protein
MALDDEGAEAHATGEQPTAADYASALRQKMVQVLVAAGHATCTYLPQAKYVPESGAVVCGCGEFEPWSDSADNPPWESSTEENDAVYRGMQEAAGQREILESDGMGLPAPGHPRGGHDLPAPADPIQATLALIDPTQIYTPEDVERHILEVLYRLETGALFERETVEAASATEMAFTRKFNAAVDASEQSAADRRKAEAMVKADAEYEAMMRAKMVKEAVKQTMHNLRAVLSGYQSTARSVGSAYQAGGSQGAPNRRDGSPW